MPFDIAGAISRSIIGAEGPLAFRVANTFVSGAGRSVVKRITKFGLDTASSALGASLSTYPYSSQRRRFIKRRRIGRSMPYGYYPRYRRAYGRRSYGFRRFSRFRRRY